MVDNYKMRQCVLLRKEAGEFVRYTAWIPSINAKLGNIVNIKGHGQWMVDSIGVESESRDVLSNS